MSKYIKKFLWFSAFLLTATVIYFTQGAGESELKISRIHGVNFVGPPEPMDIDAMKPVVEEVNSTWISIIPYAFSRSGEPKVYFNTQRQWWGEREEGVRVLIEYAKALGLKIMLKPHVWVKGEGWAGDFDLNDEASWEAWERDYQEYLLFYAEIAAEEKIEILCIGTEFRKAVKKRPEFWKKLIREIREVYSGKLTYAGNWDNVENVSFWKDLDYIGIDAYYPLSDSKTPTVNELISGWGPHIEKIAALSNRVERRVIFTEYGYRSCDHACSGHWRIDAEKMPPNMQIQNNAYEALYRAFDGKNWFLGGFLWKWFANHEAVGGENNTRFTPQNKPAMEVIKLWHTQEL